MVARESTCLYLLTCIHASSACSSEAVGFDLQNCVLCVHSFGSHSLLTSTKSHSHSLAPPSSHNGCGARFVVSPLLSSPSRLLSSRHENTVCAHVTHGMGVYVCLHGLLSYACASCWWAWENEKYPEKREKLELPKIPLVKRGAFHTHLHHLFQYHKLSFSTLTPVYTRISVCAPAYTFIRDRCCIQQDIVRVRDMQEGA